MTDPTQGAAIDAVVADAKNLPDLIAKASTVDPSLAAALSGKALIASKTPWGVLLTSGIAYLAAKYALGWDQTVDELVAGAAILAASYAMRWLSPARITGIFNKRRPS